MWEIKRKKLKSQKGKDKEKLIYKKGRKKS